jgi:4-hydroxyphenylpyruvate dioxygenase-like putative hemolysin
MSLATFTALDHVQLAMLLGEQDKARRFYRDLLGVVELAKAPELRSAAATFMIRSEIASS